MKSYKTSLILCLILVLATAFISTVVVRAEASHKSSTETSQAVSAGKRTSTTMVSNNVVNMSNVSGVTAKPTNTHPAKLPLQTGVSPAVYALRKAAAANFKGAVKGNAPYPAPLHTSNSSIGPNTPTALGSFNGMSDSASTCPYFGGCEPPDQALAVSFSWVFQGVNTSWAVYSLSGALQSGWPKTAQSFFGIPNPGACDTHGPFLTDPRAFYDQNDNRFWAEIQQVEGVPGKGANCPFQTLTWVAVSKTGDPRGAWNIYSFDMALGSGNWADYSQFGFDQQAIYYSANMFSSGGLFQYSEVFGVRKHAMENDQVVTAYGFVNQTVGSVSVDTVQPVLGESLQVGSALGGQFINSFNINFGGGQCSSGCSGVVVWSLSNPGFSTDFMTGLVISTSSYSLAPQADEPGCNLCIETDDTRITGTPTWQRGIITFALETNINNGHQNVPGIFWGQVFVSLKDDGSISGGVVFQSGYYYYNSGVGSGDTAASFGTLATDGDGDLYMLLEYMGGSINPSVVYTARRQTFAQGLFHDGGIFLRGGDATYLGSRWGDYEAVSPSGVPFTNEVWFSGEYATSTGDWSTYIGHDKFVAGQS